MYRILFLIFFFCNSFLTLSQKSISTIRATDIKVDGLLNEPIWQQTEEVSGFTQITPDAGAPATKKTTVKVLYDDDAIYIGAHCYGKPEVISKVFSQRDSYNSNTDYFSVMLDTYKDRLNGFVFSVSTLGVQYDAKIYGGSYNSKLDMIWYGEVNHSDSGYTVEIKIPYSAIRFSPKEIQDWGINFTRYHTLNREESTWNPVNPDLDNVVAQAGTLVGLKNIEPPLRLFFSPYVSAYSDHYPIESDEFNDWTSSINGGMDIKYGINEAYTLDMTLIPDFGQVVTDNVVLNLTPFEVFFQENRPFFNEGTELFEKTGHFYSRRVGFTPVNRSMANSALRDNEVLITNPNTTQLINASKVSGRGDRGLGVGVFNGVGAAQVAIIEDTISGQVREFETSPLTNYNVFVLDQNLRNNSSVTLTNTNVWRSGKTYDANVTALATQLNTKGNDYFVRANTALSQKYHSSGNEFGHSVSVGAGKQRGNFVFNANYLEQSDTYDPNDLGFLLVNNKRSVSSSIGYNIYKPFWKINRLWTRFQNNYERLYAPDAYIGTNYYGTIGITNRKFHSADLYFSGTYTENYDYFEAREPGYFFTRPMRSGGGGWVSSNYQKPLALDFGASAYNQHIPNWWDFKYHFSPRFRIGNKMFLVYRFEEERNFNQRGFAIPFNAESGVQPEGYSPIFARRDVITTTNTIDFSYTMNNKSGLTFRLRHYWSRINSKEFFELQNDGTLNPFDFNETTNMNDEPIYNTNYNAFSIDLVYRWIFSPASEINIVWKNNIFTDNSNALMAYQNNLRSTLSADQLNSFSIRIVYFVDYLDIKSFTERLF